MFCKRCKQKFFHKIVYFQARAKKCGFCPMGDPCAGVTIFVLFSVALFKVDLNYTLLVSYSCINLKF